MGVLTEIYIADVADAPALRDHLRRDDRWTGIDVKGQSEITLSELWHVLNPSVSASEVEGEFKLLTDDDAEGPWVYLIPEELAKTIGETKDEELPRIHKAWLDQEEMSGNVMDDGDAACVLAQLKDLVSLARTATTQNKTLLMWVCL